MKKNLKINSKEKQEVFILKIVTMFFKITPVLFLMYLYIISNISGGKIFAPVIEDINMTIAFITAMLGPVCGICCQNAYDNLKENKNMLFAKIILLAIALSQIILLNLIPFCGIAYVLYKLHDGFKINFKELKIQLKEKKSIQSSLISVFAIFVAIICVYARINIV
ncbi:hypothetical protein [Clostridium vincentii]|uniref:Uncharacterized protein n=1 Tax=Clostridium vincentii TaxID=52704 RepID=A0A2T0BEU2_9CLOT|nr:hypothetical protein [Clostridium vincentii]PRR82416.1 hypothetical protein CLVI_17560 [Clostridium vincentii]